MTIYVGNLADQISEQELRETFAAYGQVSRVSIMVDKQSGLRRGFGFVEMDQTDEGNLAIAELQGTQLGGQDLKVKEARRRGESNGGESNGRQRS